MNGAALFDTVPQGDYLGLFGAGKTDYKKVIRILNFNKKDVARASDVPVQSVQYNQRMPKELKERVEEWATVLATVAQYFKDAQKTVLWFSVTNPLLGNIAPREMIRLGRFNKLQRFILNALNENKRHAA